MDLVFSDIHADIYALQSILDMASSSDFVKKYGNYSRIINLGDILERGTHPKEVISKLQSLEKNYPIHSVMGNHDEAFLYNKLIGASSIESMDAHTKLNNDDMAFFRQNNDGTFGQQLFADKKNKLLCVHGGPLDPKKITPENANDESWLYHRSWQRLTPEDFEFFSYSGYHYKASSAFDEAKNNQSHVILCGHQHEETALIQDGEIHEIYSSLKVTQEKTANHILERREIEIIPSHNYIIRLGLGGPAGKYGGGHADPHFGIVQYDPKKVILFTVKSQD
jgi:predicted MPP superfamily phosphohydrolase